MHPKNLTPFSSLDRAAADPRIVRIWYEGKEDGIWAEMVPGWKDGNTDCHCIHEWKVSDFLFSLKHFVEPCKCEDCVDDKVDTYQGTVVGKEGAYWRIDIPECSLSPMHLLPQEIKGVPYEGMKVKVRYVSSTTIGHYIAEEVK